MVNPPCGQSPLWSIPLVVNPPCGQSNLMVNLTYGQSGSYENNLLH